MSGYTRDLRKSPGMRFHVVTGDMPFLPFVYGYPSFYPRAHRCKRIPGDFRKSLVKQHESKSVPTLRYTFAFMLLYVGEMAY